MPSLTDKLRDLGVQVGASQIKTASKKSPGISLSEALEGRWETNRSGECFVVRKDYPFNHKHGNRSLSRLPDISIFEPVLSSTSLSDIPLEQFLFIDTETTGLSGGAGTYVFLVGAAKYDQDGIHFAQFFLQDPANEPCQLAALEDFCSSSKVLVSYNGKSFDLPRIKNRFLFHGWPAPFQDIYHLDLLHIVRRLWKTHLPTCTLGDIEYHLLGVERSSQDIPGWQVSEKFFEYLQNSDPEPLKSVFYHNEVDVISLITLLSYITDRLLKPLSKAYRDFDDLVPIGQYLYHLGRSDKAIEVISRAISSKSLSEYSLLSGLTSLASIHKKNDEYHSALPLWKKCADMNDIQSKIELAMYYEHQAADYQEAIHWTLSAQASMNTSRVLIKQYQQELDHRLNRLKEKEKKHAKE
jgi:uncharacterized protein YprB with RNaseH-like and TPR domain